MHSGGMSPRPTTSRTTVFVLAIGVALFMLVALLAGPLNLWAADPEPQPEAEPSVARLEPRREPAPQPEQPPFEPDCAARSSKACHDGDVWWFDGCGEAQELAESCEGHSCNQGSCARDARPDPRCAQVSAYGICEGDRALACIGDRIVNVDCAAKGERCVMTREGARCLPRDAAKGCSDRDRPVCTGDRLRECVDGLWDEIDCAARGASCLTDGDGARCGPSTAATHDKLALPKVELCNERDDDGDGQIDEAAACEVVPLVAFVPAGAQLSSFEARKESELEIVNRVFAPLRFVWARTVEVPAAYRVIDPERLEVPARTLSQQESRVVLARTRSSTPAPEESGLAFYIPVLFSEQLLSDPPKAGLSTLPNATCGGVRISDDPSPPHGLIVLSDARMPETLSHELGHYLGLCHTHEELDLIAAAPPELPSCQQSGDGICDTAPDPGPNQCFERAPCDYFCPARSARPDANNLMSYYMTCRREFSADQLAEITRVLALRRGWFRCLDPQDCPCQPGVAAACPAEMSCHPGRSERSWSCELDGPSVPGAQCRGATQCSSSSICLASEGAGTGRCIRPCVESEGCTCIDLGLPFKICSEDLGTAL
jgi:hypothetical protein